MRFYGRAVAEVAIGLGSNLGDREAHLREAVRRLAAVGAVTAISSLYQTAPVGFADQDDFLNACLVLETDQQPEAVLQQAHAIEQALARIRTVRNGPRTIDVDLLLWLEADGTLSVWPEAPTLPHPRMHDRRFVLAPLAEIAGDWEHPTLHQPVGAILDELPTGEAVTRVISQTWPPSLAP